MLDNMRIASARSEPLGYAARVAGWLRPVWVPFVVSRALILIVAVILEWLLDTGQIIRFGFVQPVAMAPLSATFDANWYSDVAYNGYHASPSNYHFLPLFPFVMRTVGTLLGLSGVPAGYNLGGVVASHIFFLVALVLLYRLTVQVLGSESLASRSVWLLSAGPWSYVFSMAYTEALFLCLTVGAFLVAHNAMRKRTFLYPLLAGLLAALATLTRHTGLFVAFGVAFMMACAPGISRRLSARNALLGLVPTLVGFGSFVLYVGAMTGNNMTAFSAYEAWGKGYWYDLPRLFSLPPQNPAWVMDVMEFAGLVLWTLLVGVVAAMTWSYVKGRKEGGIQYRAPWPGSLALLSYVALTYLLVLKIMTANQSWGRYMTVVFPLWWAWAWWARDESHYRKLLITLFMTQGLYFMAMIVAQVTP